MFGILFHVLLLLCISLCISSSKLHLKGGSTLHDNTLNNNALNENVQHVDNKLGYNLYVLQLKQPINPTLRSHFQTNHPAIRLNHYIPDDSFLLLLNQDNAKKLQIDTHVHSLILWRKDWKSLPSLSHSLISKPNPSSENIAISLSMIIPPDHDQNTIILNLQQDLNSLLHTQVSIHILPSSTNDLSSINALLIYPSKFYQSNILRDALAQHPFIYWFQHHQMEFETELKFSKPIIESGHNQKPFTAVGINGRGQSIGVVDSGLDVDSCFFWDPANPPPFTKSSDEEPSENHRKLISYYHFMDKIDVDNGHGTHVSSIVAGKSLFTGELAEFNGIAHEAKIAFMDVGCQTPGGCRCDSKSDACPCFRYDNQTCPESTSALYLPTDPNSYIFPHFYRKGVRIFSASLGSPSEILTGYGTLSRSVDEFLYNNDDFIVVWSAGNEGVTNGYSTLTGEYKEAKNHIVVGASVSSKDSFLDIARKRTNYNDAAYTLASLLRNDFYCSISSLYSDECALVNRLFDEGESACCQALNSCSSLVVDLFNTQRSYFSLTSARQLFALTCCRECLENLIVNLPYDIFSSGNLADFSSLGPTIDGRFKPDVVVPGHTIQAARSDNSKKCTEERSRDVTDNLTSKSGTSMAAPTAAGIVAMIRQYLQDGFHPTGEPDSRNRVDNPSSALIKALMIDSARPLKNFLRTTLTSVLKGSQLKPSQRMYHEGFGQVNLQNTLKLPNSPFELFFVDRTPIQTGEQHEYVLTIDSKYDDLSITLAWIDPPASPTASISLVNDLDLLCFLEKPGDDRKPTTSVWFGNAVDSSMKYDRLNNVERILIENQAKEGDVFRVVVRGYRINSEKPQNYALVVTSGGKFDPKVYRRKVNVELGQDGFESKPVLSQPTGIFMLCLIIFLFIILTFSICLNICVLCTLFFISFQTRSKIRSKNYESFRT